MQKTWPPNIRTTAAASASLSTKWAAKPSTPSASWNSKRARRKFSVRRQRHLERRKTGVWTQFFVVAIRSGDIVVYWHRPLPAPFPVRPHDAGRVESKDGIYRGSSSENFSHSRNDGCATCRIRKVVTKRYRATGYRSSTHG